MRKEKERERERRSEVKISKTRIASVPREGLTRGMKELGKEEKVDDDGNIPRIILCRRD